MKSPASFQFISSHISCPQRFDLRSVFCEHLRTSGSQSVASLLNLFCHFMLVSLLLHQMLVFLALRLRLKKGSLHVYPLPDCLSLLDHDLLFVVLELDLHVEHLFHLQLLLLAALLLYLHHGLLLGIFLLVEIACVLGATRFLLLKELVCNISYYLVRLGSPVICLVSLCLENTLH